MGGARNREEKKKQNKVFSSGGGGGTKGPDKVDKRNQELPCPHCDRIFKQVQRLRDHIAKQHAEEEVSGDPIQQAEVQEERIMDIGSTGGNWSKKSPRLLLLEWTQAQKRPKPRYKVLPEANGTFRCKVVLPDPKDNDNDKVFFLQPEQACGTEDEAHNCGALGALHGVAGDRALHRILPSVYLERWEWHNKEAEHRKEAALRRAEKAEAQKERDKARKAAEARRKPSQVVMSNEKRQILEAALRDGTAHPSFVTDKKHILIGEIQDQLEAMGFSQDHAASAIAANDDQKANVSLGVCVGWLCATLPANTLPKGFEPDMSGSAVEVIDSGKSRGMRSIEQTTAYGYSTKDAQLAMSECRDDSDAALSMLYARLTDSQAMEGPSEDLPEEWMEELEALEAIHSDSLTKIGPGRIRVLIDDGRATLDIRIGPDYPHSIPFIGYRDKCLHPAQLLQITRDLADLSRSLLGVPMVHDIIMAVPELESKAKINQEPQNLHNLFSMDNNSEAPIDPSKAQTHPRQKYHQHRTGTHKKRQPSRLQVLEESAHLLEAFKRSGSSLAPVNVKRRKLPAFQVRSQILDKLDRHQTLVISGSTGCGKSTQVPQYILEAAIQEGKGAECSIVCTQPRRISAIGLAHRVSQERGEAIGSTVGYSVRFDTKISNQTRLQFCTTGILLRRLISDPDLEGLTHIIVDEVHERSLDSDLLLLLLRGIQGRQGKDSPKVVLMSATADADLFCTYFKEKADKLSIAGFTHPVTDFHLEDAFELTQLSIGPRSRWARKQHSGDNGGKSQFQNLNAHSDIAGSWADLCEGPGQAGIGKQYSEQTLKSLEWIDQSLVNMDLIEQLICQIVTPHKLINMWPECRSFEAGKTGQARAILVFLPGVPEIDRLAKHLARSQSLEQAARGLHLKILPLHGSLSSAHQARVFEEVGPNMQKIVLATNVAETSITIDDVVCVIDSGRVKELRYDSARDLSRLEEGWVSKAAAAQRRGRAGRVQPGICFKLFSSSHAQSLQEYQIPEIQRVPLHQLCLTVRAIMSTSQPLQALLQTLLTPPSPDAVTSAVEDLIKMGALTQHEELTPLGSHLVKMPMHPRLAKALIYAAMLRCLDPVLTVVSALAYGRSIFQAPHDKREEASLAKKELVQEGSGAKSDHLTIIAAYNKWTHARLRESRTAAKEVCSRYFLSETAMEGVLSGRKDFASSLVSLGFVQDSYVASLDQIQGIPINADADEFSTNARIVKAAICAGFYPALLRVEHPNEKYAETHGGVFAVDAPPAKIRFIDRVKGRVFIHPGSIIFNIGRFECPWLIYTDMAETSKVFCREASMVPIYSLLLFGGELSIDHDKCLMKLDGWAAFKASPQTAVLLKDLRREIDRLLERKLESPELNLRESRVVNALHQLLATDGF